VKAGADKTVIIGDLIAISANAALAIKNCAIPINPFEIEGVSPECE